MLKQDFEADQKQDDAARDLGLGLPAGAEKIADLHARAGDHKGGHADDGHAEQGIEKRACGDEPERDAAFAVSVCKGLAMPEVDKKLALRLAAYFGGFQALMPLLGWLLGSRFAAYVQRFAPWRRAAPKAGSVASLGAKSITSAIWMTKKAKIPAAAGSFCSRGAPCIWKKAKTPPGKPPMTWWRR